MNTIQINDPNDATTTAAAQPDQRAAVAGAVKPGRKRRGVTAARDADAARQDSNDDASPQSAAEATGSTKRRRTSKGAAGAEPKPARDAGSRPSSASATKGASSGKARARDKQSPATVGKSAAARGDSASGVGREGSKTELVLKKLRLAKGVTIAQLSEATGWQAHSVRGFLSAVVRKKMEFELTSDIGKDGVRRYRIADGAAS